MHVKVRQADALYPFDAQEDERGMDMARVALVTGGTRGIGAAVSQALQAAGYTVVATYAGNTKAAETFAARTGIRVHQWDIGDFDAYASGVKAVEESLGPIDILVNNAGIVRDAALHKLSREQWDAVIRTNLDGLFNMCRQVIEGMRARKFGRIITISSINGQKGQFGQTNYSAAKAGELGFTKALALETARLGMTVNAICPGYIHTEMLDAVPLDHGEEYPAANSGRPARQARGDRARRLVSRC